MKKMLIGSILGTALVGFGLLRIYGAYQNEQRTVLLRVNQEMKEAAREQRIADKDDAEMACSHRWADYHLAELDADYVRITKGEVAYDKAQVRLLSLKPLCDTGRLSFDAFMRVNFDSLDHATNAIFLKALVTGELKYASDFKMQTYCIWNKTWDKVTGVTPQTNEEWVKFLAQTYGGDLGELVMGKRSK